MTFTRSKTIPVWIKSLFTILIIGTLIPKILFTPKSLLIGDDLHYFLFIAILEISFYVTYILTLFECKINKHTFFYLLIIIMFLLLILIWNKYNLWLSLKELPNHLKYKIIYSPNILLCFLSIFCLSKYLKNENQHAQAPVPLESVAPVWVKIIYSFIIITGFTAFSQVGLGAVPSILFSEFGMSLHRELVSFLILVVFTISIVCAWTNWILTLTNQKISRFFVNFNLLFLTIGTLPVLLISSKVVREISTLKDFLAFYTIAFGPCLSGIISLLCCYLYLRK